MTKLTEEDLEKREKQYDQAVMKSDRAEKNGHKSGQKGAQKKKPVAMNSEDEDEKDAFDMFNLSLILRNTLVGVEGKSDS